MDRKGCAHRDPSTPFFKKTVRVYDDAGKRVGRRELKGDECPICKALGMRRGLLVRRTKNSADIGNDIQLEQPRPRSSSTSSNSSVVSITVREPQRTKWPSVPYPDAKSVLICGCPLNLVCFDQGADSIIKIEEADIVIYNIPQDQHIDCTQIPNARPYQKLNEVEWRLRFQIEKGMNGETYHGLVGALITNTFIQSGPGQAFQASAAVVYEAEKKKYDEIVRKNQKYSKPLAELEKPYITVFQLVSSASNQRQILFYYLHPNQLKETTKILPYYSTENDKKELKPAVTHAIASFFEMHPLAVQQAAIHDAIVEILDDRKVASMLATKYRHFDSHYMKPSYLGKYFVNRYLKATWGPKCKLPKMVSPTQRIAFLFVRRNATAGDPRSMDTVNLGRCLTAIARANEISFRRRNANRFTHVIIWSDLGADEVQHWQSKYYPETCGFEIIGLTAPFFKDEKNVPGTEVWKVFKTLVHFCPTEIMIIGIFLALKERYGPYISFIGFRSGSLDFAGLMGGAVFSLDNVIAEKHRRWVQDPTNPAPVNAAQAWVAAKTLWEQNFKGGEYLWDVTKYGSGGRNGQMERMEECSRRLNSFITINLPLYYGKFGDGTHDTWGGQGSHTEDDPVIKPVIHLEEAGLCHLSAALAIWALEDIQPAQAPAHLPPCTPLWTHRIELMMNLGTDPNSCRMLRDLFATVLQMAKDIGVPDVLKKVLGDQ